jgi:hypothetical protein
MLLDAVSICKPAVISEPYFLPAVSALPIIFSTVESILISIVSIIVIVSILLSSSSNISSVSSFSSILSIFFFEISG